MKDQVIYKLAKTKKIQTWKMELSDNKYRTISGYEDGEKVTSEWTVCKGKNTGRANATTPEQQAIAEVEAHYTKKLAQGGYFEDREKAVNGETTYTKPMLAKDYNDYVPTEDDFAKGKVFCQPKLDGCLSGDTLVSTSIGNISIKEIVEKNIDCQVLSYNENTQKNEYKPILNYMKNQEIDHKVEWFEIELENNQKIKITGNHLVYLPLLKCYRRVDELTVKDIVLLKS